MQATTEKRIAAFEKRLGELGGLREEIKRLEAKVAVLSNKIEKPRDRRGLVGTLTDNSIAREADALGRELRRKQKKP